MKRFARHAIFLAAIFATGILTATGQTVGR